MWCTIRFNNRCRVPSLFFNLIIILNSSKFAEIIMSANDTNVISNYKRKRYSNLDDLYINQLIMS